jgi:hypothetical protein
MTKCKVCLSKHRAYIEQQKEAGVSLRDISSALSVKWNENISHTLIGKHFTMSKSLTEALTKRVRNLERWCMHNTGNAQYTAWNSYTIDGSVSHSITYQDIFAASIPNSEALEKEYMDSVDTLRAKQKNESGLVLNDSEFDAERAEIKKNAEDAEKKRIKDEEDRKMEFAMQELRDIEAQKVRMQEMLENTAKKMERRNRLDALRDAKLEAEAGIDSEGNSIR